MIATSRGLAYYAELRCRKRRVSVEHDGVVIEKTSHLLGAGKCRTKFHDSRHGSHNAVVKQQR